MRRNGLAAVCVATMVAIGLGGCAPAPTPPPAGPTPVELQAAADALDLQFKEAFNRGDAEALAATYWNSPDLVSMAPDSMTVGFDATKAGMSAMFASMPGAQLELIEGRNDVHGEMVIGWGRWRMTIPGTTPTVIEGRYSDVKAMKDGKMVYVIDHASVPLAPPPAEIKK